MQQMMLRLEEALPEVEESLFGVFEIIDIRVSNAMERFLQWLDGEEMISFDLETIAPKEADINTPLHADMAQVVICAMAHRKGAVVLTCPYQEEVAQSDRYWAPFIRQLRDKVFIVHNASYDMQFVYRIGKYIPDRIVDTMTLYGLVTPGREITRIDMSQSLASAVFMVLGYKMDKSVRESFNIERFQYITTEQCHYAAEDAQWTYLLAVALAKQIERDEITHIAELECLLAPVLIRMKTFGVLVDISVIERYGLRVDEIQQVLEDRLYEIMSHDNVAVVAFDGDSPLTISNMVKLLKEGQSNRVVMALHKPVYVTDLQDNAVSIAGEGKARTVQETINVRSPHFWGTYLSFISNGRIIGSESKNIETFANSLDRGVVRSRYPRQYDRMIVSMLNTILDYRAVSKINSTYLKSWQTLHKGGRIHTTFIQTYAESGRLSSRHPNLQNCPRPDTTQFLEKYLGEPLDMRSMFVAPEGMVLITADYSQYELRVAAERSLEYKMIEVYQQEYEVRTKIEELLREYGYYPWQEVELEDERYQHLKKELATLDFHKRNAALIFRKELDEVTKQERTEAKAISFGVLYGMQAPSLAETINRLTGRDITIDEAQDLLNRYFHTYKQLKRYIDMTIHHAHEKGYVTSMLGRKRWCSFPNNVTDRGIHALMKSLESTVEREAVNHTIQATNADATKIALVLLDQELKSRGYDIDTTYPVLTVHDEIVVQSPKETANEVALLLRECMIDGSKRAGMKLVPTVVELSIGPCWSK